MGLVKTLATFFVCFSVVSAIFVHLGIVAADHTLLTKTFPLCYYGLCVWVVLATPGIGYFRVRPRIKDLYDKPAPPITVIKMLYGVEEALEENLMTFLDQDYPDYEVIFSIESKKDPAYAVAVKCMENAKKLKNPPVVKITTNFVKAGINPKVNNCVAPYEETTNEWVFLADSSTRAPRDLLRKMAYKITDDVGCITAMICSRWPKSWGGCIETNYMNAYCSRAMVLLEAVGYGEQVVGKAMMFRRSLLEKMGGMRGLSMYSAEDVVVGQMVRQYGYSVKIMPDPIDEYVGNKPFREFWKRHTRWHTTRRCTSLPQYIGEFTVVNFSACLLAAYVAYQFEVFGGGCRGASIAYLLHFLLCWTCDSLMCYICDPEAPYQVYLSYPIVHSIVLPMWLKGLFSGQVSWRGREFEMGSAGLSRGYYRKVIKDQ